MYVTHQLNKIRLEYTNSINVKWLANCYFWKYNDKSSASLNSPNVKIVKLKAKENIKNIIRLQRYKFMIEINLIVLSSQSKVYEREKHNYVGRILVFANAKLYVCLPHTSS